MATVVALIIQTMENILLQALKEGKGLFVISGKDLLDFHKQTMADAKEESAKQRDYRGNLRKVGLGTISRIDNQLMSTHIKITAIDFDTLSRGGRGNGYSENLSTTWTGWRQSEKPKE